MPTRRPTPPDCATGSTGATALALKDYEELRQWSVRELPTFWGDLWDYFDLQSPTPWRSVLADNKMPGARWFDGAQVNYAQQLLRHVDAGERARVPAVVFRNERLQAQGRSIEIGWAELARQSASFAAALRAMGVQRGDRVAAYLPNVPQALVAFLACASLGAIWSLCAPDMGAGTVADRFKQIEPKVLIACDGTVYGGKTIDRRELVAALLQQLPSVESLVTVPCLELATGQPASSLPKHDAWRGKHRRLGRLPAARRACVARMGAVRSSAVDRLFERHHRPAEADRARPRRRDARGAEAAQLPPEPRSPRRKPVTAFIGTAAPAG